MLYKPDFAIVWLICAQPNVAESTLWVSALQLRGQTKNNLVLWLLCRTQKTVTLIWLQSPTKHWRQSNHCVEARTASVWPFEVFHVKIYELSSEWLQTYPEDSHRQTHQGSWIPTFCVSPKLILFRGPGRPPDYKGSVQGPTPITLCYFSVLTPFRTH